MHEWIVQTARRMGLKGATVLEGFAGFRLDGKPLDEHAWSISQHLPVIVEVVDRAEAIEGLLGAVEPEFRPGTITLERAHVLMYRAGADRRTRSVPPKIEMRAGERAAHEVKTMNVPENGVLLRIFMGEADREPGTQRSLFEAIVRRPGNRASRGPRFSAAPWASAGTPAFTPRKFWSCRRTCRW